MPERSRDWWRQAEADLRAARDARESKHFEWAALASHQAAGESDQSSLSTPSLGSVGTCPGKLFEYLPNESRPGAQLMDRACELDKHYIPTRYPNGFERGAPVDYYTRREADVAIENAEAILEFCKDILG